MEKETIQMPAVHGDGTVNAIYGPVTGRVLEVMIELNEKLGLDHRQSEGTCVCETEQQVIDYLTWWSTNCEYETYAAWEAAGKPDVNS